MYPFDNNTYVRSYLTTYLTADVQKGCHLVMMTYSRFLMDGFVSRHIFISAITILRGSGRGFGIPFGAHFRLTCTDGL